MLEGFKKDEGGETSKVGTRLHVSCLGTGITLAREARKLMVLDDYVESLTIWHLGISRVIALSCGASCNFASGPGGSMQRSDRSHAHFNHPFSSSPRCYRYNRRFVCISAARQRLTFLARLIFIRPSATRRGSFLLRPVRFHAGISRWARGFMRELNRNVCVPVCSAAIDRRRGWERTTDIIHPAETS